MAYGMVVLAHECGFFETLAPTTSTGITARLLAPVPITGAAQAGNAAYITLAAGTSTADTETRIVGRRVTVTSGTGMGQVAKISAFTQSNQRAAAVFETAPDNTSRYRIDSDYDGMIAKEVLLVVETNSIRYRVDGVAPLAGVGQILTAGQSILIQGVENLRKFRCIDTAAGASSVSVHVYF
jgi:hypothetical protein